MSDLMPTASPARRPWHALLILVLGVWLALLAPALSAQEVGLAARVNGVAITVFRLERYFEDYLREQGRNVATLRSPAAYKRLKREALERLIVRELLVQEAARRGLVVTDDEVAAARFRVMAGYKEPQAFHRRLAEAGFSDAIFDEHLRQDLLAQQALAALAGDSEPDADTVSQAYQAQRERFIWPEQVRVRHILVRVAAGAGPQAWEQARQRLQAVAARIADGADFAVMARAYSDDASHERGGDLGFLARGRRPNAFEELAFGLAVGELGGPVQTSEGWHLIRVEARRPEQEMPESQAQALIRQQLVGQRRAMAESAAVQALWQGAQIQVLLPL